MRRKTPLHFMELLLMLLVFSLSGAFCLKAFVWADLTGQMTADRGMAALQVESAAEIIKACRGDMDGYVRMTGSGTTEDEKLTVYFDGNWNQADEESGIFCLVGERILSGNPLLGQAEISVTGRNGDVLFSLEVCWQEGEKND